MDSSFLLSEDGKVYSFERNKYDDNLHGKLVLENTIDQSTPQLITALENIRIKKISCGGQHSILLNEDGMVYSFGYNYSGQLGLGNTIDQSTPQLIKTNIRVIKISCVNYHSILLSE